jgi:5-formyltetrahydrofolate cyclo-ligase
MALEPSEIQIESARLRRHMQTLLRSLTLDSYRTESTEIIRALASWEPLRQAKVVAAFFPSRTEPQIQPLLHSIASSRTLLLPRVIPGNQMEMVQGNDAERDVHLALKAWSGGAPDVILVPGVVFGKFGERIGHGGGYYDRFLSKYPKTIRIGVALSCQVHQRELPQAPHDVRMSYIVSPIGIHPTGY